MVPPIVAIVRDGNAARSALLDRAIERVRLRAHPALKGGRVIIIPALDAFQKGAPTATDPRLIEQLIDTLFDCGASHVDIGSTRDSSALWLENRDPFILADLLGYRYETPSGRPYDVIDLAEDLVDAGFPATSPLAGTDLARAWTEADVRIVFSKNRTDEDDGYALCLSTLLRVLPQTDKDTHYRHRRDPGAVVAALLTRSPVDFAFIDAVVSAHGEGGHRSPQSIATGTIIAATNPALADHYGALLMGLDPFTSSVAAPSLQRPALLNGVHLSRSLDRYSGWINVSPALRKSTAKRRQSIAIDRSVRPLLQAVDRDLFPFSNPANDRANAIVAELVSGTEGAGLLTMLNSWLAQLGGAERAWATQFGKDGLHRIEAPINVKPDTITDADYAAVDPELRPLTALLDGVDADETGLRWRMHDGAILFDGVRRYPIPFDRFAAAVEIGRTIQYMNDYIGGSSIVTARDTAGRALHQLERNLYLPQPNYTALIGGEIIDVTKIEAITYARDRHRMVWKTILSANGSARADDGVVTFEALGQDTLVTIWGRQHFRQPPLIEAFDLDLYPALKRALVEDAYHRFFARTFANLEAVAEGRDVRIGRDWPDDGAPLPVERLTSLATALAESSDLDIPAWIRSVSTSPGARAKPLRIDDDGFHHFEALKSLKNSAFAGIVRDLEQAARVDAGLAT